VALVAVAAGIGVPALPARAGITCNPSMTDYEYFEKSLPNRPWPLVRLQPERVWPVSTGKDILVAVIDSGVSNQTPVLEDKVRPGFDLLDRTKDGRCDPVFHGTLVAGLIAGREVPGSAVHGLAPDAVILPIRAFQDPAPGEQRDSAADSRIIGLAIRKAVGAGASVINISLTTVPTPELADAVRYALRNKVVVVAAAGNTIQVPDGVDAYPAAYEGVIAVASLAEAGNRLDSSVIRDYIDVAAPGENIYGPAPRGGFVGDNGTSFASAYVTGVVALLRAYRPELTPAQIEARINRTADPNPDGKNAELGYGAVNPYWAVLSLTSVGSRPPPPVRVGFTQAKPDPLHGAWILAIWVTVGVVALSTLLVASVAVWRRGQRRHWRPGRPASGT
jgi:type VII secretion-associated serine protease mycosin